jgi:endonuclease III
MTGTRKIAKKDRQQHADVVSARLAAEYPGADCALRHENALQLLVATILSAQCTDKRVNEVTKALFAKYETAQDFADADLTELEEDVRSTGFYRNKAKSLKEMSTALVRDHGGEVPSTMEDLTALRGVARKTANVVLGNVFNINDGVVVDTHVKRLSNRMGLSSESDPEKIERDLMALIPRDDWTIIAHRFISHGRAVCPARKPKCGECVLSDVCPSAEV